MPEKKDEKKKFSFNELLDGSVYFGNHDDSYFDEIIEEMDEFQMPYRKSSFADYVRLYRMAGGESLEGIIQSELDEDGTKYWNDAKAFLDAPLLRSADKDLTDEDTLSDETLDEDTLSEDISDEDSFEEDASERDFQDEEFEEAEEEEKLQQQRIREYGKMFRNASEQLMKEAFPDSLPETDKENSMQFLKAAVLANMSEDYLEIKNSLESDEDFLDAFGGSHEMSGTNNRIELAMIYGQCVKSSVDTSAEKEKRAAARIMLEQYGHLFAGKSIRSLPAGSDLGMEIINYLYAANFVYATLDPEQKEKMDHYLDGTGQKPAELFDRIFLHAQERLIAWQQQQPFDRLKPTDHGAVQGLPLFGDSPERKALYYSIREKSGKFAQIPEDSAEEKEKKSALLREGNFCFQALCRRMGLDTRHPMYEEAGYKDVEDLFFIDGIPAAEYVKKKYPDLAPDAMGNGKDILHAEIVSAVLSGEHHVEAAKLGFSQNHAYDIGVFEVRLDSTFMDGQEPFYRTKPSKKAEKFYSSDKDRTERQNSIRGKISERFAIAATREINEAEYRKHPHTVAMKRFSQDRKELTDDYFEGLSVRYQSPISMDSFLTRQRPGIEKSLTPENRKELLALAQLKLLADHPGIRVADLTDSSRYEDEKYAAGSMVLNAYTRFLDGPQDHDENDREYMEPLADIVRSGMRAIADMDVRKELLYAIGEPMDLKGEEALRATEKPENLFNASSFLSSLNDLALSGRQAFSALGGGKSPVDIRNLDPEKADSYPPFYAELLKGMDAETMKNYRTADCTLSALSGEYAWNQAIAGYLRGEYSMKNPSMLRMAETEALKGRIISSCMREKIADYGKAAAIPGAADMAEISHMDSWQNRRLGRFVEEGLKSKKLSMAEQMKTGSVPEECRRWVDGILSEMDESRKAKGGKAPVRVKADLSELERKEHRQPAAAASTAAKSLGEDEKTHSGQKKERTL